MKIAILGAAGVRTPLIVQAVLSRQGRLGVDELALMDIDGQRLELMGAVTRPAESSSRVKITRTTDARLALRNADYVITTFRVGGMEARVIDERVALEHGLLGQETTGPGGFAMGMRSIPVLLNYVRLMQELCPQAWLINFANPAGLLAEAVIRCTGWKRVVGICDAPSNMQRVAAALLSTQPEQVHLDYFGLNHLGWVRKVICDGQDHLPAFLRMLLTAGKFPALPFDTELLSSLGMIPNEYLYYYYYTSEAVQNILAAGVTRGEQLAALNQSLYADLEACYGRDDHPGMQSVYQAYLSKRSSSYMRIETGTTHNLEDINPGMIAAVSGEGYAGVALDLIEALSGSHPREMILNIPNQAAIPGMHGLDVVEIPAWVQAGTIQPLPVGEVPDHCLGLMKQVKAYENLSIQAATKNSYPAALSALALHPLVHDLPTARRILEAYRLRHAEFFPVHE